MAEQSSLCEHKRALRSQRVTMLEEERWARRILACQTREDALDLLRELVAWAQGKIDWDKGLDERWEEESPGIQSDLEDEWGNGYEAGRQAGHKEAKEGRHG